MVRRCFSRCTISNHCLLLGVYNVNAGVIVVKRATVVYENNTISRSHRNSEEHLLNIIY